jgi:carbonic anhydrase
MGKGSSCHSWKLDFILGQWSTSNIAAKEPGKGKGNFTGPNGWPHAERDGIQLAPLKPFLKLREMKPKLSLPLLLLCFLPAFMSRSAEGPAVREGSATTEAILERLKEGNARFRTGRPQARNWPEEVRGNSSGQQPFASIVSCMDSRISSELIFDQGLGDIFSIRIAGNVVNQDVLGSLEYAAAFSGAKVILVLGHSRCGAVQGAVDSVELGNLTGLLKKIKPAIDSVPAGNPATLKNLEFVGRVARANVKLALHQITENSPVLRELARKGDVVIIGGMYHIEDGTVEFYPIAE